MRLEWLGGAAAIALLATMGTASTASAAPCTSGGCTFTIDSTSFTPLNLGAGGTAGFINNTQINNPGGGISNIMFGNGVSPNNSSALTGLYVGTVSNVATTPFGPPFQPTVNNNLHYLAAQPGTIPGSGVTINYTNPQTTFDLLWGTVDSSTTSTYNLITNSGGTFTLNGNTILAAAGGGNGTQDLGVEISFATPFNSIILEDGPGNPSAFEFVPGTPIPEPASMAILGAALAGFGVLRRRRKTT